MLVFVTSELERRFQRVCLSIRRSIRRNTLHIFGFNPATSARTARYRQPHHNSRSSLAPRFMGWPCRVVLGLKRRLQRIESTAPEAFVVPYPFHAGMHRRSIQPAGVRAPRHAAGDQSGTLEHPDVFRFRCRSQGHHIRAASSPAVAGPSARVCSMARRVGSASAVKSTSSGGAYSTIWSSNFQIRRSWRR